MLAMQGTDTWIVIGTFMVLTFGSIAWAAMPPAGTPKTQTNEQTKVCKEQNLHVQSMQTCRTQPNEKHIKCTAAVHAVGGRTLCPVVPHVRRLAQETHSTTRYSYQGSMFGYCAHWCMSRHMLRKYALLENLYVYHVIITVHVHEPHFHNFVHTDICIYTYIHIYIYHIYIYVYIQWYIYIL